MELSQDFLTALRSDKPEQVAEALKSSMNRRGELYPVVVARIKELMAQHEDGILPSEKETELCLLLSIAAAYRATELHADIVQLFRSQGATIADLGSLLGDMVTECSDRIIAATFNGDAGLLHGLIEDTQADPFVRRAGLRALARLVNSGKYPMDGFVVYLTQLAGGLPRPPDDDDLFDDDEDDEYEEDIEDTSKPIEEYDEEDGSPSPDAAANYTTRQISSLIAEGICDSALMANAVELSDIMVGLWKDGLSYLEVPTKQEAEQCFADRRNCLSVAANDVVEEPLELVGWWRMFSPLRKNSLFSPIDGAFPAASHAPQPYIAPPKIGRNDPCPCGSGKKFKKCCGG